MTVTGSLEIVVPAVCEFSWGFFPTGQISTVDPDFERKESIDEHT